MNLKALGLAGVAAGLFALPALAHHSFAMFDAELTMSVEGAVHEFQWTNPHSWMLIDVPNESGEMITWAFEMGGPSGLARNGWRPRTVVPGDMVSATFHPLKNGDPGGQLLSMTLPDGTVMGD